MPSQKVLEQKQQIVADLVEVLKGSQAGVLVDYRGLTVEEDTQLRNSLRSAGIRYSVIKNSLLQFAVKEVGLEGLEPLLAGPTALAVSDTDPVAPAKAIVKFAKDNEKLEIKGGFIDGKPASIDEIKKLSDLPSKEELIAKIMGSLNSPASGIANSTQGVIRALTIALNAVAEQKQAAGE